MPSGNGAVVLLVNPMSQAWDVKRAGKHHLLAATKGTDTEAEEASTPVRVLGQMLPVQAASAAAACPGSPVHCRGCPRSQ